VPAPSSSPAASGLPLPSAPPSLPATPAVPPWLRTVDELVALAVDLGVDGLNVDIEALDALDRTTYGTFLGALRAKLRSAMPEGRLTVATEAGMRGTANAAVASASGVDRLFLMGYDYHFSTSQPGATSPVDRNDGLYTLRWSIDRYVEAGVPRDRILLGLPLYGMKWRLTSPSRTAQVVGEGVTWVPSQHRDLLLATGFHPGLDILEISQVIWEYDATGWLVTYFDSPATLRPKLALALDNGLAGAGFWAMGYERGLPGYVELMTDFRGGDIARSEAPPRPSATP
jgi:spore germination protein YaaH